MATVDPTLRKQPQQERSRRMVERILDAARSLLVDEGLERMSTNRVASRAGISPGSLYQYFPDKAAVLAAVVDRYAADVEAELTALLTDRLDLPPAELVRASYEGLLDVLESHREYVRIVALELPRARSGAHVARVEQRVGDLVGAYLTVSGLTGPAASGGGAGRTRRPPASTSAWILVRMVEHLCVQHVLEQPPIGRDVLVDELVHLTAAHLAPRE